MMAHTSSTVDKRHLLAVIARRLVRNKWFWGFVVVLVIAGRSCIEEEIRHRRSGRVRNQIEGATASLAPIVSDVRDLFEECKKVAGPPDVKGTVVLWNAVADEVDPQHLELPDGVRASPGDSLITVVLVRRSADVVGRYSRSGDYGVRGDVEIAAVSWPGRIPLGHQVFRSKDPPSKKLVEETAWMSTTDLVGWVRTRLEASR